MRSESFGKEEEDFLLGKASEKIYLKSAPSLRMSRYIGRWLENRSTRFPRTLAFESST
jgi:hypothetical protein